MAELRAAQVPAHASGDLSEARNRRQQRQLRQLWPTATAAYSRQARFQASSIKLPDSPLPFRLQL